MWKIPSRANSLSNIYHQPRNLDPFPPETINEVISTNSFSDQLNVTAALRHDPSHGFQIKREQFLLESISGYFQK